MNDIATIEEVTLPGLLDRAANMLASAKTAGELLEAMAVADAAYDAAKRAVRLSKAKGAHDELLAKVHRAQADALDIEARGKRLLADEYDAAQETGEIRTRSDNQYTQAISGTEKAHGPDLVNPKIIHEARQIRNAEKADPGIVRRTLDEAIDAGEEPTKARVRRAVRHAIGADQPAARPAIGKDATARRVLEAITILSGLPPAPQVVGYFRGTDAASLVDDRIKSATDWLIEFFDAWSDEDA